MKIKIKDIDLFIKGNGIIMFNNIQQYFDVLAIIQHKKKIKFLVKEEYGFPRLYDSIYFDIIDSKINSDWIYRFFGYNNKLKNKKYMFDFYIDTYIGIKDFIEDPDFLFNVIDDPREAELFCYNVIKK